MGTVHRAEQMGVGRMVAIKFLHPSVAHDPQLARRFEVEARAMRRLSHPNCVAVLDYGVDRAPYLVMEVVEGPSLRALLQRGRLPPARAVGIARQILAGLAHAHSQSVIHRDIKPENILLDDRGPDHEDRVRLVDFGLAKLRDSSSFVTMGIALGTPHYMAPEQMREGHIDQRVDIYTVGLVLYEMLTGVRAFDGKELGEVLLKQHQAQPRRFSEAAPGVAIDTRLEQIVMRALAKSPDQRFSSAAAMSASLEQVMSTPEEPAASTTQPDLLAVSGQHRAAQRGPLGVGAGRRLRVMLASARQARQLRVAAFSGMVARALAAVRKRGPEIAAALTSRMIRHPRLTIAATAGLTVAVLIPVLIAAAASDDDPPARPAALANVPSSMPPAPAPALPSARAPQPSPARSPVNKLAAVETFLARGERERALALLRELRSAEPSDADYAASLARLAFEQRRWPEALAAFRAAIAADRRRGSDPILINGTIDSLENEASLRSAESVLRLAGDPAKPYLANAADKHPVLRVRGRARALLAAWNRPPGPAPRHRPSR